MEQQLDVDPKRIVQGDYAEAAQLLDILYELLEGLMEDQRRRQEEDQKQKKKEGKPNSKAEQSLKETSKPKPEQRNKLPGQQPPTKKGKHLQVDIPSSRESSAYKLDSMYKQKDSGEAKKQK